MITVLTSRERVSKPDGVVAKFVINQPIRKSAVYMSELFRQRRQMMRSEEGDENILADSDMANGIAQPPLEKPRPESGPTISLPLVTESTVPPANLFKCMPTRY
jgi:hypothetical protein